MCGCSVEVFLKDQLGVGPGTIGKIQSIMLDGKAVDDIGSACRPVQGWVKIKLFNLLMAERGPGLLRQGVFVDGASIAGFLAELAPGLEPWCGGATLDGRPVAVGALRDTARLAGADQVFLVVTAKPTQAD